MTKNYAFGLEMNDIDLMVIDKNRFTLSLVRSCAFYCGIGRIRIFDNVDEALEAMLVDTPNIVLSEWELDSMSGCKLLRLVRHQSMRPLCFVPFGLITPHPTRPLVQHAHNSGAHFVLSKPISPLALSKRLKWLAKDEQEFMFDAAGNCLIKGRRPIQRDQSTKLSAVQRIQLRKAVSSKKNSEVHKVIDDLFNAPQNANNPKSKAAVDIATRDLVNKAQEWKARSSNHHLNQRATNAKSA
ncbi:putative response regulator receiver protein [Roseibium sp. TrichSKD4]|nr:putative response regulator receiver protein [Roseibium sp. TrichSKD4]